jgi:hypothetical protein
MAAPELAATPGIALDASRAGAGARRRAVAAPPRVIRRAALNLPGPSGTVAVVITVYVGLWLLTAIALLAARLIPALAPGPPPHAALEPTIGTLASILLVNARVLAPPFLLAAYRFGAGGGSRAFGDLLVAIPLALVAVRVGAALGRWEGRLLLYIPQLPIEYLAAAIAASVWVAHRSGPSAQVRPLARTAGLVVALLAAAAATEVLATPHQH